MKTALGRRLLSLRCPDPHKQDAFIRKPERLLGQPTQFAGMMDAVASIYHAITHGVPICIWGDYDVDGVTGTAILMKTFARLFPDAPVRFHVPHRTMHGYSLNEKSISRLASLGVKLLITVDCGIASPVAVAHAHSLGMQVIVTDHHEPSDPLPAADHLLHCRLSHYGFPHLCGSATAFKLAQAILTASGLPLADEFLFRHLLPLAALGTVADVMPLIDENRILVHHGLGYFRHTSSPGLLALLSVAKLSDAALTAGHLGFQLGPRLNAIGRLACASLAVELLLTTSGSRAAELAHYANHLNDQRRAMEKKIYTDAIKLAGEQSSSPSLVLCGDGWHSGVVGVVASRVAEATGKPTILLQKKADGTLAGSGRSVPGIALNQSLATCADLTISAGGHAQAVGVKLSAQNLDAFRDRLAAAIPAAPPPPPSATAMPITIHDLTLDLLDDLALLAPFGMGNPEPVFNLQAYVSNVKVIGSDRSHLSMDLHQDDGSFVRGVAFSLAKRVAELQPSHLYDLRVKPSLNDFRGLRRCEVQIQDFQPFI